MPNSLIEELPDEKGHFGTYGGMFVPETLMSALEQLTKEYELAKSDPMFQNELDNMLREYVGRPTPLTFAERWTDLLGGAKIYLKREDLLHTGAHKINNAMGQILLAKRLGKNRIIAEIVNKTFGRSEYYKVLIKEDKTVQESLKYFDEAETLLN